jgi:predicted nucleic acid-binding protein
MKAFIDTNVVLDVLAERWPHYEDSAAVWSLAEQGKVEGLVSAVSFTNVFYLMRRWADAGAAREALRLLRDAFTPVSCDSLIINQAIDSDLPDFEDAVQYFSAVHAGADCILSRNPDDFPRRPAVPVLSPTEFLAQLEME